MAITTEILEQEFQRLRQELIQKHIELGMVASGNWVNSLSQEVTGRKATIWGTDYTVQLVEGREPGKFPPINAIEKWINDKGIQPKDNIPISSLAFLIARKIAREGTEYYKQGGTDLISAVITPERVQEIINKVGDEMITDVYTYINRRLQLN